VTQPRTGAWVSWIKGHPDPKCSSAMADCGFNRDQLANRMGVDVDAVNHLFAEDARPSLGLLAEVAVALGYEIRFPLKARAATAPAA
jgi:transcriptional regulator with XRE-family HTH domain